MSSGRIGTSYHISWRMPLWKALGGLAFAGLGLLFVVVRPTGTAAFTRSETAALLLGWAGVLVGVGVLIWSALLVSRVRRRIPGLEFDSDGVVYRLGLVDQRFSWSEIRSIQVTRRAVTVRTRSKWKFSVSSLQEHPSRDELMRVLEMHAPHGVSIARDGG